MVTEETVQNKWLKIILVASLAFNLAFVSTAVYRKVFTPGQKPGKSICKEDLKLKKEQKEKFKRIIKEFRINLSDYKQDILDKRIAIIEAMSDTEFNLEDIEKKTKELNERENQLNLLYVDTLIRISDLLEPEQRLNFLYKLSPNWFFINKDKKR
jgi:Spy/CpxP family protein refolding chaperone